MSNEIKILSCPICGKEEVTTAEEGTSAEIEILSQGKHHDWICWKCLNNPQKAQEIEKALIECF